MKKYLVILILSIVLIIPISVNALNNEKATFLQNTNNTTYAMDRGKIIFVQDTNDNDTNDNDTNTDDNLNDNDTDADNNLNDNDANNDNDLNNADTETDNNDLADDVDDAVDNADNNLTMYIIIGAIAIAMIGFIIYFLSRNNNRK